MLNRTGLLVTIATLTLTQSIGFAQDSSSSYANAEPYQIDGVSTFAPLRISGSFTVKRSNHDELIDRSKLSNFQLTLVYDGITISCPLSALNKFQLSDSQQFLRKYRQLGELAPERGVPVGWGIANLEISCQGKNAQFSISGSPSPSIRGKIETGSSHSQAEQSSDSSGMQITYSAGTSRQTLEFDAPLYQVSIKPINQNTAQSTKPQASSDAIGVQRIALNKAFILREGLIAKVYAKILRGLVSGYKISMLDSKNDRAVIKIERFEEYPRTISIPVGQYTLSLSEPNTITPSKSMLGDGYAIKFVGFSDNGGVELIVVYAR